MKGLLQRVKGARVEVGGEIVGSIDQGLLVLLAVEPDDTPAHAAKMLHKLLNYRVFSDAEGKMNLSLKSKSGLDRSSIVVTAGSVTMGKL